jgi:excisionase family DNA binding protein
MPLTVNGQTYYRTAEVSRIVGITKNTLLRWIREGSYPDVELRDRRGWRLFTEKEVEKLKKEVNRVNTAYTR